MSLAKYRKVSKGNVVKPQEGNKDGKKPQENNSVPKQN